MEEGRSALYRFAPAASWVKPGTVAYDAPPPASGTPNGSWGLFFDRQTNVTAEGEDFYHHSAVKVISSSGVDTRMSRARPGRLGPFLGSSTGANSCSS
jgi:hypothetical protein